MGVISNLITDMTLRGADEDELARAVKHSMVVIDAEKHKLDYKRSERENGIPELKQKWQIRVDEEGATHYGGASTLLSRRKQTVRVPERRGSVRVDKETGEYIYKESGRTFTDPKTGKERKAEDTVSLISETKDARTLSSGTIQENLYADFSNKLKAMANQARKEAVNMKGIQRNPEAAKTYAPEVASLKEKYNNMVANKPKERKAMLIANANIKAKIQEQGLDPTIDKKEIKKISSVTSMLDNGHTPEQMLEQVLDGLNVEFTDTMDTQFKCNCSHERIEKAIISIGKKDIQEMIDDGKEVEVKCHFCNTAYTFSVEELKQILKQAKR